MTKKRCVVLPGLILLLSAILFTGCGGTAVAKTGDTVKVHYTGTLDDGTIFDTSVSDEPLEFTIGQDPIIPGFEQAIIGMKVGESKTVDIPADEAYGQPSDDLITEFNRFELPEDIDPVVGMRLEMTGQDGSSIIALVTQVTETTVTLDANFPLAGEDLTFEIELVSIQ